MKTSLRILAGRDALKRLKRDGIKPENVGTLAGAAGGPKWLALSQMDKALFGSWLNVPRSRPLYLVGSSIGTWRFAAATQNNPVRAIENFEELYLQQKYSLRPTPNEITQEGFRILENYVKQEAIEELLSHPYYRFHIVVVKCKNLFALNTRPALLTGMGVAAATNMLHPKLLNVFFERTLFVDPRDKAPFLQEKGLRAKTFALTKDNFRKALMASGSIPGVMSPIEDLHPEKKVVYRDGGMVDYHMDLPYSLDPTNNDYVLFPHYTDKIVPGWFDKYLPWRKPSQDNFRNAIIVSPSKEFVSKLPYGKIPDRNDFNLFKGRDSERIAYWKKVIEASERLKNDFHKIFSSNRVDAFAEPL